jgi:hypothetical protein
MAGVFGPDREVFRPVFSVWITDYGYSVVSSTEYSMYFSNRPYRLALETDEYLVGPGQLYSPIDLTFLTIEDSSTE